MNFIKIVLISIKNIVLLGYRLLRQQIIHTSLTMSWDSVIMQGSMVSPDTTIGHHVYIGYNCFVTKTQIWNYTSIANSVNIGMWEHDLDGISTNSIFYGNAYGKLTEKDCIIWNDVWIGVDVSIRRWVIIGNGAVIGANSFVNQSIPPFAIAVGSPAKVIKYRFSPEKIALIEASEWWNEKDTKKAKKIIEELSKN